MIYGNNGARSGLPAGGGMSCRRCMRRQLRGWILHRLFKERGAIKAQLFANPALRVLDFAVNLVGSQADETRGKLDQQRFNPLILVQCRVLPGPGLSHCIIPTHGVNSLRTRRQRSIATMASSSRIL